VADTRENPHLNAVMRRGTGNRFNGFPENAGKPKRLRTDTIRVKAKKEAEKK
jgi:hypothetical protein